MGRRATSTTCPRLRPLRTSTLSCVLVSFRGYHLPLSKNLANLFSRDCSLEHPCVIACVTWTIYHDRIYLTTFFLSLLRACDSEEKKGVQGPQCIIEPGQAEPGADRREQDHDRVIRHAAEPRQQLKQDLGVECNPARQQQGPAEGSQEPQDGFLVPQAYDSCHSRSNYYLFLPNVLLRFLSGEIQEVFKITRPLTQDLPRF